MGINKREILAVFISELDQDQPYDLLRKLVQNLHKLFGGTKLACKVVPNLHKLTPFPASPRG